MGAGKKEILRMPDVVCCVLAERTGYLEAHAVALFECGCAAAPPRR